jgi:hypothetical protein
VYDIAFTTRAPLSHPFFQQNTHNHNSNPVIYASYQTSASISEDELLGLTLDVLVETNTDIADIARWLSKKKGEDGRSDIY